MAELVKAKETVNFEMVLKTALGLPGVKINRDKFLNKALTPYFDKDTVKRAILVNPASAGIGIMEIRKIADACIRFETRNVTLISAAAGIPGGLAMLGTIPADLAQFFGHVLRIIQKLVYLYGWQELFDGEGEMDDATAGLVTLFIGVMFGVSAAEHAILKIAHNAAQKAEKVLAQKALMKGAVYPIVKKVAAALGVKMTKDIFAKGVAKVIPVVGGALSGGLTFVTYKPMASRLRNHLATLVFAKTQFYAEDQENVIDVSDLDLEEILDEEPVFEEQDFLTEEQE